MMPSPKACMLNERVATIATKRGIVCVTIHPPDELHHVHTTMCTLGHRPVSFMCHHLQTEVIVDHESREWKLLELVWRG